MGVETVLIKLEKKLKIGVLPPERRGKTYRQASPQACHSSLQVCALYRMGLGYLYCFSNESMPGILKCGMTERTPDQRLKEANASDTWRPPTPYKIEFAKKVQEPKCKEATLHKLLEQYTMRINPRREFFRVSVEEVRTFFDLMDGDMWRSEEEVEEDEEEDVEEEDCIIRSSIPKTAGCRDMAKCFKDGQRIRHVIGINKIRIATYNDELNGIVYDGKYYSSLSSFGLAHHHAYNPSRRSSGGWAECECEVDGKWISTYSLPQL